MHYFVHFPAALILKSSLCASWRCPWPGSAPEAFLPLGTGQVGLGLRRLQPPLPPQGRRSHSAEVHPRAGRRAWEPAPPSARVWWAHPFAPHPGLRWPETWLCTVWGQLSSPLKGLCWRRRWLLSPPVPPPLSLLVSPTLLPSPVSGGNPSGTATLIYIPSGLLMTCSQHLLP